MYSLSWVIGVGHEAEGGNKEAALFEDVMTVLSDVLEKSGSVTLDTVDNPEGASVSLQVETEQGLSILSLGEDDGEEYVVRTYTNSVDVSGKTTILGNKWDSRLVCDDKHVVKAIFEEFFTTGTVSRSLLE